jgi:hypothetical protein
MRRSKSTAIVHTGSRQTVFGCLCGAQHTVATDYRRAKHLRDWQDDHEPCIITIAQKIKAGQNPRVYFGML